MDLNNTFVFAAYGALIMIILLLARWAWARRVLTVDAREDYPLRVKDRPASVKGVSEADYVDLYVAAYEPRWAIYAAAALGAALLVSLPAMAGLSSLWSMLYRASGAGPWFDIGYYPWMFFIFFGLVAVWAACGAVAARIHHKRQPEGFQAALARARGEPLDDVVVKKPRPKWAKRADAIRAAARNEAAQASSKSSSPSQEN